MAGFREAWARFGHEVYFGVRKPDSTEIQALLQRCGPRASAESPADAVSLGEVVVNTLPWPAVQPVLEKLDFGGKPLLDCTNCLPDLSALEVGTTSSGGELVAQWSRSSKVVKIFNSTGANNMADPTMHGHRVTMLYCGDDAGAKSVAAQLAHDALDPVDAGPLTNSRQLEPLALLWIWLAIRGGLGREFAFQIVKR